MCECAELERKGLKFAELQIYYSVSFRFHVSSACKESQVYVHALSDARCVFDVAVSFSLKLF